MQYSNVWEDYQVIKDEIRHPDTIIICSAGDNVLNLLSESSPPKRIHAVDKNIDQIRCLQITIDCVKKLNRKQFLEFIGYSVCNDREKIHKTKNLIRMDPEIIRRGFKTCGSIEKIVESSRNIEEGGLFIELLQNLFSSSSDEYIKNVYRRFCFTGSMSRNEYSDIFKNPALPVIPFVQYMTYFGFHSLQNNLQNSIIEYVHKDILDYIQSLEEGRSYTFILSDIFDDLTDDQSYELFQQIDRVSAPGSNLIYWCKFADQPFPFQNWTDHTKHEEDRILLYTSKHVLYKDYYGYH